MKKSIIFLLLLSIVYSGFSQKRKLEILHTDLMVGDKFVRKLYGNVAFKHQNMFMYCDSAYFYVKDNRFEAYNNVRIQNQNVIIYSDTLYYSSQTSIARFRGKIKMMNGDITLTTNFLDYNSKENIGLYYNNGKIIDKENVLKSRIGKYFVNQDMLFFKQNVELINKDYKIVTDTLKYQTKTKIAYFLGPSKITSKENLLYTENGWYNTQTDIAQFNKKSYLNSKSQFVYGDSLYYNRNTDIGKAFRNVVIKDTTDKIYLYGDKGYYDGKIDLVYVTNKILLVKAFDKDSLYLHADSIFSQRFAYNPVKPDSASYQIVKAYHKTRFFKNDVQGVCDSLVYNAKDSLINLYTKPVIWSDENQISGKEIKMKISGKSIDEILIDEKSFIIAQDDDKKQFNQMKGKSLHGYIRNGELYKIDIAKNGETIYYLRDEGDIVGVNKATCDSITVFLKEGKVQRIVFKSKPTGTMFPPDEIQAENAKLNDFNWLEYIRPLNHKDIYEWKE